MLTAGLGNNIFQFASTFGIAMSKNMTFMELKKKETFRGTKNEFNQQVSK
jgi:hypothetical protein